MADGVLLIPGFFGFGTFGGHRPIPIRYFDHVIEVLGAERPALRGRIVATEPPPTGSLATRVDHLYRTVVDVFARGIGPEHLPVERLHLIGHSTGGLDARLLANRHHWTGDPRNGSHADLLRHLGAVVTVAAPLHGTPAAARLAGPFALSLAGLSLLSIVAKAHEMTPPADRAARDLLISEVLRARRLPNAAILSLLLDLDPTTAGQIARFLDAIVDDHALLEDLQPEAMRELDHRLEGGDFAGLYHVVTVAPPPTVLDVTRGIVGDVFRLAYAALYAATADPGFTPAAFPHGPWLAGSHTALGAAGPTANDGVVPSSSQTVDGEAYTIVEADHLDVVGHYDSRRFRGTTVFRSDAGFDDARFAALWAAVARLLD